MNIRNAIFCVIGALLLSDLMSQPLKLKPYLVSLPHNYEGAVFVVSGIKSGEKIAHSNGQRILYIPESGVLYLKKRKNNLYKLNKRGKIQYEYRTNNKGENMLSHNNSFYEFNYLPFRKVERISYSCVKPIKKIPTFSFMCIKDSLLSLPNYDEAIFYYYKEKVEDKERDIKHYLWMNCRAKKGQYFDRDFVNCHRF